MVLMAKMPPQHIMDEEQYNFPLPSHLPLLVFITQITVLLGLRAAHKRATVSGDTTHWTP